MPTPQRQPRPARLGLAFLLWAVGLLGLLQACGGGASTDRNKAQIRLVNATSSTISTSSGGYAQLALRLDDQLRQGQVAYGDNAVYAEVDGGSPTLSITNQGSNTALLTAATSLSKGRYYTSLAYGKAGALRQVLLDDNQADPDANKALLRVVNASPDSGPLDIYVTGTDEALSSAVPVQAGAAYGVVGGWNSLGSGGWRLRVTAANSKTDVRLDVPNLNLASRQIVTLVLTPSRGAVLTNAMLLSQRGAITLLDNTQARVRVVAGLDGAAGVTVQVAGLGAPLLLGAPSPAASLYSLVTATNPVLTVTQGGTTVPLVAGLPTDGAAVKAGADLTLLLLGSTRAAAQQAGALAPSRLWIEDSNRAPDDATQARVRLVNGLAERHERLVLSADYQPLAGTADSPYTETAPGTSVVLRVTREGSSAPLFESAAQTLVAGGTYTVFIVGSVTPPSVPVGIVRRDR